MTGLLGCGEPPNAAFEPGDESDPIVRSARQALNGTETVTLTFSNQTQYDFVSGLITFSALSTVDQVPSRPLFDYVRDGTNKTGKPDVLASGVGLSVGTTAFVVPSVPKQKSTTLTLVVPANVRLFYLARVAGSIDDFVAVENVPLSSGVPGSPIPLAMRGYDLSTNNFPNGLTTLGNGTVGATPPNTILTIVSAADCPSGPTTTSSTWLKDDFSARPDDPAWPRNAGWDGEFNGDWYTDGKTVRVWNPNWGNASPAAPIPTTTGFWKFFSVCPASGSRLTVEAKVVTQFSDPNSDSTLVVYFFDRAGTLLSVTTNHPLRDDTDRRFAIYDAPIPPSTRSIAVAPMMFLAKGETGAAFFDWVQVDYETATQFSTTTVATDDFSSFGASSFGGNQPTNWGEFGGDWYVMPTTRWATVWNPAFASGAAGVDTGLFKTFNLANLRAGDVINARVFAAATFTDRRSFARLRLVFNTGAVVESDRQARGYGNIDVRRAPIPAGASSVQVIVNAFLGPTETSSLYVDNFRLETQRRP